MIFMLQGPLDQFFHMGQPSLNPSGSAKQTHRKGSKKDRSCLGVTRLVRAGATGDQYYDQCWWVARMTLGVKLGGSLG